MCSSDLAQASATVEDPAHPPASAFDGDENTWYGTGRQDEAKGESLTATFHEPFDLTGLRIYPGASSKDAQARPQQVEFLFVDADGGQFREVVTLEDTYEPSFLRAKVHRLVKLHVTIDSAYGAGEGKQVAIREIRLFGSPSGR